MLRSAKKDRVPKVPTVSSCKIQADKIIKSMHNEIIDTTKITIIFTVLKTNYSRKSLTWPA